MSLSQPDVLILSTNGHRGPEDYELWRNPLMLSERTKYVVISVVALCAWLIYYFADRYQSGDVELEPDEE